MNKNRSPFRGTCTSIIGITLLMGLMIYPLFYLFNYTYINSVQAKNQDVQLATTTDAEVTEEVIEEEVEEEKVEIVLTRFYYPSEVSKQIEEQRYKKWIENEEFLPTREKLIKNQVEEEEANRQQEFVVSATARKSSPVATTPVVNDTTATATDASYSTYEEETVRTSNEAYTYYACYSLTAYCATGNACADGVMPSAGYTVASNDPNLWHKWIYIEGYGDYYVHDRGGMASNVIDIFMSSYDECIQFGRRSANIYIYN